MKTLTILFLLSTISSVCLSSPHRVDDGGGGGGFTVDLIHRDSPLSPTYNPANAQSDLLQNSFRRSLSRACHLSRRAGIDRSQACIRVFLVPIVEADIIEDLGEYLMSIQIGTPPVKVTGVVDTGSDLTWAQCEPCGQCFEQRSDVPFLAPSSSSTYQPVICKSKTCDALSNHKLSCYLPNVHCKYKMIYGDRSFSMGDLATDTFWFGPTPLKDVAFGCGHVNNGTFGIGASGIVGLGGGSLSIVNQLSSVIQGKFSYCLIPSSNFNETTNQTSKIHFGSEANIDGPYVVSTPLIKKNPATFYYLTLESIMVGKNVSEKHPVQQGNIIIDSGTALTFLPNDLYDDLVLGLIWTIEDRKLLPQGDLDTCYEDLKLYRVPTVTFQFTGADVVIPPEYLFLEVEKGISCLMVLPTEGLPIFGNLLQRNLLVGYDLVNQTVSFSRTDCTKNV